MDEQRKLIEAMSDLEQMHVNYIMAALAFCDKYEFSIAATTSAFGELNDTIVKVARVLLKQKEKENKL